jgi:hypothetical protein
LFLSARRTRQAREALAANPFAAMFSLLFLAGYFLLYAWYNVVSNDTRFVLAIFLPFLFAVSVFVLRLGGDRVMSFGGRQISFERFFSALILGMAGIDLLYNAATLAH